MSDSSFESMMQAVQSFHDKHDLKAKGGEDLIYRVGLMSEELGEIAAAVTKGKGQDALAEECADLFILILGTAIAADFDLAQAFWAKMEELMGRSGKMIEGRIRVSRFRDEDAS